MTEVVVFGVVAVDIVLRVAQLPRSGEAVTATALGWRIGGSSANLACGLSSAGHVVRLVGPVGQDALGRELLDQLRQRGVRTDGLFPVHHPTPRALVLLEEDGERTILSLADSSPTQFLPPTPPVLSSAKCVFVESYDRYPATVADSLGAGLLVASPPTRDSDWPADVVIGSATQYGDELLACPYEAVRAVAGTRLQWVVVTRGRNGADAYNAESSIHVPAVPVRQEDATGAGDAFAAGVLHGLLRGDTMVHAMELGAVWGATAVARLQSLPPTWTELLEQPQIDGTTRSVSAELP